MVFHTTKKMYLKILLLFWYSICAVSESSADLCDTGHVNYIIGQTTTILDVQAEEISRMSSSCYKEVVIPGAWKATFHVDKAEFGFNKAYEYSKLLGTGQILVYDSIFVQFGHCSSMVQGVQVTTGLRSEFDSDILCLHITPELKYRPLRAHITGGRIQLDIRVNIAVCPAYYTDHFAGKCLPLCSAFGKLHNCNTVTTLHPLSPTQSLLRTVIATRLPIIIISTKPKNFTKYTARITTNPYTTQRTSTRRPRPVQPTSSMTTTSSTLVTLPNLVTTNILQSPSSNIIPHAVSLSSSSTKRASPSMHTTTLPTSTAVTVQRTAKFSESFGDVAEYTSKRESVTANTTSYPQTSNTNLNFGLMEGLYVIAGCIVILLLLGIAAFLIRKRKYASSSGSNTVSVLRNGLHWRDNWLVRFHNNEMEGDISSQPDSEIQYIHTNFLGHSNNDIYNMHNSEYPEIVKNKQNENPYDNPWHLVRLDSDFVRNTKNLGGNDNLDCSTVDVEEQPSLEVDRLRNIIDGNQTSVSATDICSKKTENVNNIKKTSQNSHYFTNHFGSPIPSKGKYNVAKVERSNSKRGFRPDRISSEKKERVKYTNRNRTHSEPHLARIENKVNGHTRETSSSSPCSKDSPTFEEMLKDEIHSIEDALDSNVDTESQRSDRTNGSDVRRNWKVSTLYAIVSAKNGTSPPQDVFVAKKPSQKRDKSEKKRSESQSKNEDRKNKRKQCYPFSSEKDNLCKEKVYSQQTGEKQAHVVDLPIVPDPANTINSVDTTKNDIKCYSDPSFFDKQDCLEAINKENKEIRDFETDMVNKKNNEYLHETRKTFLQNRERFEQDGSIKQHVYGASGTGQFPK